MFWKKKITCEHEWVDLKVVFNPYTEIFCPKCNQSKRLFKTEADLYVKRSELRKAYLQERREMRMLS